MITFLDVYIWVFHKYTHQNAKLTLTVLETYINLIW